MREEAEGRRNRQDDRQWIQEVAGTQESRWPRDGTGQDGQETLLITAARMRT